MARFTPLLLAQARYRMGERLRARYEPEDVVNDVWARVLPRLTDLGEREGRHTPVLLRFLSTAVLHQINNLLRLSATNAPDAGPEPLAALDDATRGPLTRTVERERQGIAVAALEELEPRDREIVLLRVLEQHSNSEAAQALGIEANTAAQVFRRALEKLRRKLPGSIFDEIVADS